VLLIDRYAAPGGQYFKPVAGATADQRYPAAARDLLHRLRQLPTVHTLPQTTVWGAFPAPDENGWLLTLHGADAPDVVRARAVILATGAYDRVIPFPGWTLPGVITAGAAQTFAKHQGVAPGQRIVVAGTGPLLPVAAANLAAAGATVLGVYEGAQIRPGQLWRALRLLPGQGGRLRELAAALRRLIRHRIPYRWGMGITAAAGDTGVAQVTVARLDRSWRPRAGTARTLAADTAVVGCGFHSAGRLARLLGCALDLQPERGGLLPQRNRQMETSRPGIFAAGDGAGIGGVQLARIEGRIAGTAAAAGVGYLTAAAVEKVIAAEHKSLVREKRFAQFLADTFSPGPAVYDRITAETLICRCEEVPFSTLRRAAADGALTADAVKGLTRCGMGSCQGRICEQTAVQLLAREHGMDPAAAGAFTIRPPLEPLTMGELAKTA